MHLRHNDILHNGNHFASPFLNSHSCIVAFMIFLFSVVGCGGGRSVPPYPPPLTIGSLSFEKFENAAELNGNTLRLEIVGLRNAKQGIYLDLLVIGEDAYLQARRISGMMITGWGPPIPPELNQCVELRRCTGETVEITRPYLNTDDYVQTRRWRFPWPFASAPQVNAITMAGPTYDLPLDDGTERVIQTIPFQTHLQLPAGCYEIRILPTFQTIIETPLELDLAWNRFDLDKP